MIENDEIFAKADEFGISPSNVQRGYVFGWLLSGLYEASTGPEVAWRMRTRRTLVVVASCAALAVAAVGQARDARTYPLHTNIVSTTFWVGEIFDASLADGSQACSAYDAAWAFHWSGGRRVGTDPSTSCAGAPIGGCDGVPSGSGSSFSCATQRRTASNGYFPTDPGVHPAENPFYVDVPFDDVNDETAFEERCRVVRWASRLPATDCAKRSFSYMKNHWVRITGPSHRTCFGQVEDAGPSSGRRYHDAGYVFSTRNARPANTRYSGDKSQGAGMDVSPALNGCLGFKDLNGDDDHVTWRFVDVAQVPAGPWLRIVTIRGVTT